MYMHISVVTSLVWLIFLLPVTDKGQEKHSTDSILHMCYLGEADCVCV